MMNKLVSLLRSPYPVLFQRWKSVVIPSAIVAFILYAFQPFGISLKEGSKLGIAIGSGGITAGASVICHYLLPALFPSYYKEQHWTLGKYVLDLLLLFFLIAVGLWLYISWLSGIGMNGSLFPLGMHVGDDSGSFPACLLPDMEPEYGVGAQSEGSSRNKLFPAEEDVCGG